MPNTKNALVRYKYLDELLSDHHHYYCRRELADKVNAMLERDGYKTVDKRTIETDINNLMCSPFNAPIVEFKKGGKIRVTYSKSSYSLFTKEMSREECNLLREVLSTLGQFGGIDNFKWLDDFKIGLGIEERRPIISFSNNEFYESSNKLGVLFDNISNEVVVKLSYHTFENETVRSIDFHPYLLKQYNDRWYVIGAADSDNYILNFALDRIDGVEPLPAKKFVPCPDDLYDRFEEIVGVTYYKDRPSEHILIWVSDAFKGYVETKPLHGTQTPCHGEKGEQLHEKYPQLKGGEFYTLDCIRNHELIQLLCIYGKDMIVLESSGDTKEVVYKRIKEMFEKYSELRT